MGISTFDELKQHIGHQTEIVAYGNPNSGRLQNVAVECIDCSTVIIDYDREEKPLKCIRCGETKKPGFPTLNNCIPYWENEQMQTTHIWLNR